MSLFGDNPFRNVYKAKSEVKEGWVDNVKTLADRNKDKIARRKAAKAADARNAPNRSSAGDPDNSGTRGLPPAGGKRSAANSYREFLRNKLRRESVDRSAHGDPDNSGTRGLPAAGGNKSAAKSVRDFQNNRGRSSSWIKKPKRNRR